MFIKPIDEEVLLSLNNTTIIIVEEVSKNSSLFSYILEKINEKNLNIIVYAFNINEYPKIGSRLELQQDNHLDIESVRNRIKEIRNK